MSEKPLLLLDVDGPLNPFRAREIPEGFESHDLLGYRVLLNPDMGPLLWSFAEMNGMELVWATMWEQDANSHIAPIIGLPELPVIEWGFGSMNWKFEAVVKYAGDRPLAWLDDDFEYFPYEQDWFWEKRGHKPTLLQNVSPYSGIRDLDLEAIEEWVKKL